MNRTMTAITKAKAGFTMAEMMVVLMILSIIAATMMMEAVTGSAVKAQRVTLERMQGIESALNSFYKVYNRLPCPAPIGTTSAMDLALYGRSVVYNTSTGRCTAATATVFNFTNNKNSLGSVPVKDLGLPDEYALDGWGRRISYYMSDDYGTAVPGRPKPVSTATNILHLFAGNPATAPKIGEFPILLVSHGKSGHGSVPANGATNFTSRMNTLDVNDAEATNTNVVATTANLHAKLPFLADIERTLRFDQIVHPVSVQD